MDEFTSHQVYVISAQIVSLPVFLANLTVVVAAYIIRSSTRDDLRVATILLGNVALADMVMPMSILFGIFYPRELRNSFICAAELGATAACSLTSMCCIVLIALDRYFFIVHSIRYDHYMSETRARLLINLSWLLGILFGFVPVMVKSFYNTEEGEKCRFVTADNIDVMLIAGGFAFPLILATFLLYMAIYWKARKASKAMWPTFQKTRVHRLKTRSVIVVFLSSSCFLITWGPYLISLVIYGSMCGGSVSSGRIQTCKTLESLMASPFPMLGFLNSLINPIIFAWWHRPFTKALNDIFSSRKTEDNGRSKSIDISTIVSHVN